MCQSKKGESTFFRNIRRSKCEGNIGELVEEELKVCDEVETVREFTYLGDRVSAGGGCKAAVTAGTRIVYVKLRQSGELLFDRRLHLNPKCAV